MQQDKKLKKIINSYPDVWMDYKRFKALLMDYYPEDKVTRNLLLISCEEKIPEDIKNKKKFSLQERKALAKRIISACNCSNDDSDRIVYLWFEAFDAYEILPEEFSIRYIDRDLEISELGLEINTKEYVALKRAGIINIQDLINKRHELLHMRNIGKLYEDLLKKLLELGYDTIQYPIYKNDYSIDEKIGVDNSVKFYDYIILAKRFGEEDNHKMVIHTLEKAVIEGFKGDYSPIIKAYYIGASGVEKDLNKVFFYAQKWNEDFKSKDLIDLPEPSNRLFIWYVLVTLLINGYGNDDDVSRKQEIHECLQNIVRVGIELGENDKSENLLLGEVGIGLCRGFFEFPDVPRYDIDINIPLGYQALTLASENGTFVATKTLLFLFYDEKFKNLNYGNNQKAYEFLFDLYCRAWKQNKEELLDFWNENVFSHVEVDIKINLLDIPIKLKNRLADSGINTYSYFYKNDITRRFQNFGLEDDDLIRIVTGISQYMEEKENA